MHIRNYYRWCTATAIVLAVATAEAFAATPPALTDGAPAAGARVRVYTPEYAGTNIHHDLYLPTDWQPDHKYPVIVEYAPNDSAPFTGSVDDTHLGFYQSGGEGFIWVSMPFINTTVNPAAEATRWWGNGSVNDPVGEQLSAEYTKTNLIRILEDYGGDPSRVFLTGFSRGAIATGYIGLRDDEMADIWLGFLPHSHHDGGDFTPDPRYIRLSRISGRASFITYGENDGGAANSINGVNILDSLGFPVESHELVGLDHTDEWITDANTPFPDTSGSTPDVRARLREWLDETMTDMPGTHSVSGMVMDSIGQPVVGARIQSGDTHWTYTDENGLYELAGLIDSNRTVTASHDGFEFLDPWVNVVVDGADVGSVNFVATPEPSAFLLLSLGGAGFACGCRRSR